MAYEPAIQNVSSKYSVYARANSAHHLQESLCRWHGSTKESRKTQKEITLNMYVR